MIIETNFFYKLTGFRGLALWPFIFINDKSNKKLIHHEQVHLRQQMDGWLIGYYIKYLYYLWKYGYWDNPYEVEAREISGHH